LTPSVSAAIQSSSLTPQASSPSSWLSPARAAELLGVSVRTVQNWCTRGRLNAEQIEGPRGLEWRIDPAAAPETAIAHSVPVHLARGNDSLSDTTEADRAKIHDRLAAVRAWRAALARKPAGRGVTEFQAAFVAAWNARGAKGRLAVRTLRRWDKRLADEGLRGLLDARGRAARQGGRLSPELWDFIQGRYCSEAQPAVSQVYEEACALAAEKGWSLPSLRRVQQLIVRDLDPKLEALGRRPKAFRDRCVPTIQRDWSKVPAMAVWVGDHRQFDVLLPREIQDPKSGTRLWRWSRPWLTCYLDGRSWYPSARKISWDPADGDRTMAVFVQGVREHGQPGAAYLDNGKDFRFLAFSGGRPKVRKAVDEKRVTPILQLLGIDARWALPFNARAKVVEPFFRIVSERFDKRWETYCGRSTETKPERVRRLAALRGSAEEWARKGYTIEAFEAAFNRWINEDYALRESPSNACPGMSALRAFRELRGDSFQAVRPADATLVFLLMPSKIVQVQANGIWVHPFRSFYWSDEPELERRRAAGSNRAHLAVRYRYDPDDPSAVWVFDRDDRFLCRAGTYLGAGIDPLAAPGSADAERLADAMAFQRGAAKRTKEELAGLQIYARNALLEVARKGAGAQGLLEDPARIPNPALPIIRFTGDFDKAAHAAASHKRTEKARRAGLLPPTAADLLAAQDPSGAPATPGATALDLLIGKESRNGAGSEVA